MIGKPVRYPLGLRVLHWLMAVLVVLMFALGLTIAYAPPADEARAHLLFNLHESTGLTLLALLLLRALLRLRGGAPALPRSVGRPVRVLARLNHAALYLLLMVQPVLGLLDAYAAGAPLVWYELVPVPLPIARQPKPISDALVAAHWWGAAVLFAAVALHVAGAAWHGLIRRDGVVRRMV